MINIQPIFSAEFINTLESENQSFDPSQASKIDFLVDDPINLFGASSSQSAPSSLTHTHEFSHLPLPAATAEQTETGGAQTVEEFMAASGFERSDALGSLVLTGEAGKQFDEPHLSEEPLRNSSSASEIAAVTSASNLGRPKKYSPKILPPDFHKKALYKSEDESPDQFKIRQINDHMRHLADISLTIPHIKSLDELTKWKVRVTGCRSRCRIDNSALEDEFNKVLDKIDVRKQALQALQADPLFLRKTRANILLLKKIQPKRATRKKKPSSSSSSSLPIVKSNTAAVKTFSSFGDLLTAWGSAPSSANGSHKRKAPDTNPADKS